MEIWNLHGEKNANKLIESKRKREREKKRKRECEYAACHRHDHTLTNIYIFNQC